MPVNTAAAAAVVSDQASNRKAWFGLPKLRFWASAKADLESAAAGVCQHNKSTYAGSPDTAPTAGRRSPSDYRATSQADVHSIASSISGTDCQHQSSQGTCYDYSSTFTSADCCGSNNAGDSSSINWLHGGSSPGARSLSLELSEQRLHSCTAAPEVSRKQPPKNSQYHSLTALHHAQNSCRPCALDEQVDSPSRFKHTDSHLQPFHSDDIPPGPNSQDPSSQSSTSPAPRLNSFCFDPPTLCSAVSTSPFAIVALRKSQSFGSLPSQPIAPGHGLEINNRVVVRSATGDFRPKMSLQDQQQFLQNDWLLLQQQSRQHQQGISSALPQQTTPHDVSSIPPNQQQHFFADDPVGTSISIEEVRLELQEMDVRSRHRGRNERSRHVGLEDEKHTGQEMDNDRWIARRRFVLDSIWAAEGAE